MEHQMLGVFGRQGKGFGKEKHFRNQKKKLWSYNGVYGSNKSINTPLTGASSNPLIFAILMVPIKQASHGPHFQQLFNL